MPKLEEAVAALYSKKKSSWSRAGDLAKDFLREVVMGADPAGEYGYSISEPRIKNQERAITKLRARVDGIREEDLAQKVESLISDWVGVKLTCNNTDEAKVAIAKLRSLCQSGKNITFAQKRGKDDVVDYIAQPKESGYRAFHAVLVMPVLAPDGEFPGVKVEVQIKTRLQDAWGELTHENFYKNSDGSEPTAFHNALAKTMADLLASVDELAQKVADDIKAQNARAIAQPRSKAELVTVVRVEPTFALVSAEDGRQGLIRASYLRALLAEEKTINPDEYISVDDHLEMGAKLWALREAAENEKLYFNPTSLGADR
ncbi:GTP pyrophosphokinase [Segniliparus rugosus]|nr:RelA/SpoT protein [Segniliparus rugosus]